MIARTDIRGPLTIAAVILAFFLGKSCHQCPPCPGTETVITGKPDSTVTIEPKKDSTVSKPKPTYTHKGVKLVPAAIDSPHMYDPVADSGYYPCPSDTNVYDQTYCDGAVKVHTVAEGEVLSQSVEFEQKTVEIHRTDTLIRPPKWDISLGGAVIGNHYSSGAGLMLLLSNKNNRYMAGYDPIRKEGLIGAAVSLWKSKK